ncbi:testis-expressed protein 2-like [Mizuhopecten yessoensis]|uniref:Testis-expressed sequence 2 protein n=1 Tax=Mizuhopecten yessoensis TaxID=6573 RepID=A0A210PN27_MIZYE|nr:testis-expressed protein 2-like [Mizuhopecten yessoensis]OWF37881.1 Testis-expressed sequence 2 protein [Mizuhopecten yessoensis]
MSLKRDSIPPPRPPAPKSFTRRSASNNSIKKSFKLLEEDEEDEEDLTVLTGEFDKKLDKSKADASKGDKSKESTPVKTASSTPQNESKTLGLNQRSRSLDDDKSSSNVSRIKQNFVDISSGLKDKLAKKWEEISAEINSPVDGNTDQKTEEMVNQNTEFSRLDVRRLEIQMSDNGEENLIIETAKNSALDEHIKDEPDKKVLVRSQRLPPTPEETPVDSTGTIQIVDDFFPTEPSDSSVGANVQSNELRQRKNSSLKKILKNKGSKASNSPTGTPVSMSKLMTKNDTEDQDIEVQSANTEFFDASDMDLTSNNSVQSDPISGNDQKLKLPTGHVKMSDLTAVPVRKLTAGSIFIFFYWILPLPSYISGMLMGMFLACAGWAVYLWLNKPPTQKPPIERLPVNKLPPMVVPEMKDVVTEDGVYKGWMNEIPIYNPEKYHINQTHSIYVDLENAALRLRRPKTNIAKRSMWDEPPIQTPQFIHQRHYNLEGSKVFLVPPGLVKKRIWSKKYPICVALASVDPKHHAMVNEQKLAETPDSESGFEIITDQNCGDGVLFLFARTCREKEDWYKRFTAAAAGKPLPSHLGLIRKCISKTKSPSQLQSRDNNTEGVLQHKRQGSTDSTSSGSSSPTKEQEDVPVSSQSSMEDFIRFMGRVMPKEVKDSQSSPTHVKKGTPEYVSPIDCDFSILWLNALINRVFWDFLHEQYFIDKVLDKLQRKLSKIHIPYFIEELKITNIDLGNEVPSLRRGARPYFDEQGFWVDVDINYEGGFQMTIETKVNLMRLKKTTTADKQEEGSARKSAITDEDEEDSAESSSDEEEDASSPSAEDGARGGKASRKIMGYLGKITQSKYFQSATEIKYIKKKMEEVSNTPIELTVEVRILSGTMAVNIPPPPTDRLWYGFRGSPKLQLVAKPKVGARELTLTHITEWIEKKLSTEFQRTFVYPNLDDLEVPTFTTYTPSGVDPPGLSGNL